LIFLSGADFGLRKQILSEAYDRVSAHFKEILQIQVSLHEIFRKTTLLFLLINVIMKKRISQKEKENSNEKENDMSFDGCSYRDFGLLYFYGLQ
jgi:hypothetical protein